MMNFSILDIMPATVFTLSNGMKCVHRHIAGQVAYCGVAVNAGSRDEPEDAQGLAHFVEHTLFKGTKKRRSWHISNRMESVGGELNAYTSKEETMIYANAPAPFAERAIELIADIIANSTFPARQLDKERHVVCEEIKSYLDSPDDQVFDEFENLIYANSALGHNILGTEESVARLSSGQCRCFLDRYYMPSNMVAYIAYPGSAMQAARILEKHLGGLHFIGESPKRQAPTYAKNFSEAIEENGYQAHTIMGARVFGRTDPRRFALFLLNNYLGGPCMNSRLNQELRDKRGYVYTVESTISLLSDCGIMQIYFGSDSKKVEVCRKIVMRELEKLASSELSPQAFMAIKRQYAGQLIVAGANTESMAMQSAKSLLYYDKVLDTGATARSIMEVKPSEMRSMADMILSEGLSTLTLS